MKKIEYQAPEMEVLEVKLQGILCTSPSTDDGDNSGINPGELPPATPGTY